MAVDQRKRQKKLERHKARRKAQRRELAKLSSRGLPVRLREASAAPILHCGSTATVWDEGLGEVLISRQLRDGSVAFAVFLVDRHCLGVKDVFFNILPRAEYQEKLFDKITDRDEFLSMKPECVRKLVEGAVQYAENLGISPHPDYDRARLIFGDIQAEACTEEYEFGKDGKPFFYVGPFDTPARCQEILRALERHCGPDGFHYVLPGGPGISEGVLRLSD